MVLSAACFCLVAASTAFSATAAAWVSISRRVVASSLARAAARACASSSARRCCSAPVIVACAALASCIRAAVFFCSCCSDCRSSAMVLSAACFCLVAPSTAFCDCAAWVSISRRAVASSLARAAARACASSSARRCCSAPVIVACAALASCIRAAVFFCSCCSDCRSSAMVLSAACFCLVAPSTAFCDCAAWVSISRRAVASSLHRAAALAFLVQRLMKFRRARGQLLSRVCDFLREGGRFLALLFEQLCALRGFRPQLRIGFLCDTPGFGQLFQGLGTLPL